uniref:Reverse transcriptase Ty1/copia-type domain-containing protein n=1 Tax=Solanum lycopersicum TaxID=4081 RepID=A0A3Q7GJ85_SOLLC
MNQKNGGKMDATASNACADDNTDGSDIHIPASNPIFPYSTSSYLSSHVSDSPPTSAEVSSIPLTNPIFYDLPRKSSRDTRSLAHLKDYICNALQLTNVSSTCFHNPVTPVSFPFNKLSSIHQSIYGLKQASRHWYSKLTKALNFKGNDAAELQDLKSFFDAEFKIEDLGHLYFLLGWEFIRKPNGYLPEFMKSYSRFYISLGSSPISLKSKNHASISLTSAEDEYKSMTRVVAKISSVSIHIAKSLVFHERTKHAEIDCHFIRQQYLPGLISLSHLADLFTKPSQDLFTMTLVISTRFPFWIFGLKHGLIGPLGPPDAFGLNRFIFGFCNAYTQIK